MTTPSEEKMKEEEKRQAEELLAAISEAINAHGRRMSAEGRVPIMNSALTALAAESGKAIASVEPNFRRHIQQKFDETLRHYRRHFEQARVLTCVTLNFNEPRQ